MWEQRAIRILKRIIFCMLLFPLLGGMVYTLAQERWTAALVLLILVLLILYKGLVRIRVAANSVAVRDGKVVYHIPEKCVRDRFDFASRGQTLVELPSYGLTDRPFAMEVFLPAEGGGIAVCRLSVTLGYIADFSGWQRAYDSYTRYQNRLPLAVKAQLFRSSAGLPWPSPLPKHPEPEEFLKPVTTELDRGIESYGLRVVAASCTFAEAGNAVRFLAPEQEVVEKAAVGPPVTP